MSELAERDRVARRGWAAPGGSHDRLIRLLKIGLPAAVGIILAFLAFAPLERNQEVSFVLDKNKAQHAEERMRATAAQYRGEDNKGRPFALSAGNAVQLRATDPNVRMQDLTARMQLEDGPAVLTTRSSR